MTAAPTDPLIVTVTMDLVSQAHFDRLRTSHFPSSINYLAAHVTLFHHLPGEHRVPIEAFLRQICRQTAAAPFTVTGLRFLGRGTAYTLDMPVVAAARARLAAEWAPWLTNQDRQAWKPHVTVQNKVQPHVARATFSDLQAAFTPFEGRADGLRLWAYLGGPWEVVADTPFTSPGS